MTETDYFDFTSIHLTFFLCLGAVACFISFKNVKLYAFDFSISFFCSLVVMKKLKHYWGVNFTGNK